MGDVVSVPWVPEPGGAVVPPVPPVAPPPVPVVPVGLEGFGATVPTGPTDVAVTFEVSVATGAVDEGGRVELPVLDAEGLVSPLSWLAHDNGKHTTWATASTRNATRPRPKRRLRDGSWACEEWDDNITP